MPDIEGFFNYLLLIREIRQYWPDSREKCPAFKSSGSDFVNDKCYSMLNHTGECTRNACPVLWE